MKDQYQECRHCHGQGVGSGGRCILCGGKGVVRPKPDESDERDRADFEEAES